jgi:hypothetical protein
MRSNESFGDFKRCDRSDPWIPPRNNGGKNKENARSPRKCSRTLSDFARSVRSPRGSCSFLGGFQKIEGDGAFDDQKHTFFFRGTKDLKSNGVIDHLPISVLQLIADKSREFSGFLKAVSFFGLFSGSEITQKTAQIGRFILKTPKRR